SAADLDVPFLAVVRKVEETEHGEHERRHVQDPARRLQPPGEAVDHGVDLAERPLPAPLLALDVGALLRHELNAGVAPLLAPETGPVLFRDGADGLAPELFPVAPDGHAGIYGLAGARLRRPVSRASRAMSSG